MHDSWNVLCPHFPVSTVALSWIFLSVCYIIGQESTKRLQPDDNWLKYNPAPVFLLQTHTHTQPFHWSNFDIKLWLWLCKILSQSEIQIGILAVTSHGVITIAYGGSNKWPTFCRQHFKCNFFKQDLFILFKNSLEFLLWGAADNQHWFSFTIWHKTSNKPQPAPRTAQFSEAYMCH